MMGKGERENEYIGQNTQTAGGNMRLVINALSARLGGGQTYVVNLLRHFAPEPGDTLHLLLPEWYRPALPGAVKRIDPGWPTDNPFVRTLWEAQKLPALLTSCAADVLFCPSGILPRGVPVGVKTVVTFQNMMPFDPITRQAFPYGYQRLRNRLLYHAMRRSLQAADLVIFISQTARKVIAASHGLRIQSSVVVPHGIDPAFSNPAAHTLDMPIHLPPEGYLLYVSEFWVYKHQLEVVRGYHRLKERNPEVKKLVLAGPNDSVYGKKVIEEIRRLGLGEDIIVTGSVPHLSLPLLYRNASVNIFASSCENCPFILLEALAAGRPVLASRIPPMPEFGGDAVVYFDPRSPVDFAEKLAGLMGNRHALTDFALRAANQAAGFDWETSAGRTWGAIRRLADMGESL